LEPVEKQKRKQKMLGPPKSDSERGEEGCLSFKEELEI
jgi:hypothetical protein